MVMLGNRWTSSRSSHRPIGRLAVALARCVTWLSLLRRHVDRKAIEIAADRGHTRCTIHAAVATGSQCVRALVVVDWWLRITSVTLRDDAIEMEDSKGTQVDRHDTRFSLCRRAANRPSRSAGRPVVVDTTATVNPSTFSTRPTTAVTAAAVAHALARLRPLCSRSSSATGDRRRSSPLANARASNLRPFLRLPDFLAAAACTAFEQSGRDDSRSVRHGARVRAGSRRSMNAASD